MAQQPNPPIRLGFDTYSLRAFRWKALQLLDYAAAQKLDTVQISDLADYESLEPAYLSRVRDRGKELGLVLDGGMGCICPLSKGYHSKKPSAREAVLEGLKASQAIGATSMRCFMGSSEDRLSEERPIEQLMEETIRVCRSVKSEAQDLNVKIALENHAGDLQAREVLTIIQESGPDYVAACLDTGNPMWVMEDPVVTMEVLGPHVVTTHVRDSCVFEHPRGAAAQWVALGDGNVDLTKVVELHRKLCPNAGMQLEIITGRPPRVLPFYEQDFWRFFPKANASEFARFVNLARGGHPFMGTMVIEDAAKMRDVPAYAEALREQQKIDLERSFEYAKRTLGVGIKGREAI